MKIEDITCADAITCSAQLKITYPNMISISHIQNAHIIIESGDYDVKGHVKFSRYESAGKNIDAAKKIIVEAIANKEFI